MSSPISFLNLFHFEYGLSRNAVLFLLFPPKRAVALLAPVTFRWQHWYTLILVSMPQLFLIAIGFNTRSLISLAIYLNLFSQHTLASSYILKSVFHRLRCKVLGSIFRYGTESGSVDAQRLRRLCFR